MRNIFHGAVSIAYGRKEIAPTNPRRPIKLDFTFHGGGTIFHNSVPYNHCIGNGGNAFHTSQVHNIYVTNRMDQSPSCVRSGNMTIIQGVNKFSCLTTEELIMVAVAKQHNYVKNRPFLSFI
jgi:hypothetical protein